VPTETKEENAMRVLLADDHAVLRAGTRRILEDEPDMEVVGEAGDGREAVALAERTRPDIVLLDITMPDVDGIAACQGLRRVAPDARILVLTAHDRRAYVRALYRLGAAGYVLKSASAIELVAAIRRVYAGEQVYAAALLDDRGRHDASGVLTARELGVVRELARGRTNREIALSLGLSENTIEFHVRNLYAKLGASARTDAVLIAQRLGWLDSSEPLC
jgi:DNA-binding NarL/FixJ family response regulator